MRLFGKPREKRDFYLMMSNQSEKMYEGILILKKFMETSSADDGMKIVVCEREGDELRKILIDELNKTFITPFEREDIFNLSRGIDDMLDYARSTYEEMQVFNLGPTDELRDMVELVVQAAEHINYAMRYLKNNPTLSTQHAINAKKVENQIETRYREALEKLFSEEDIRHIFRMREVYRHISNMADKSDYTADAICHIVVKIV